MNDLHKSNGRPPMPPMGGPGDPPLEWQPPMADISWVKRKFLDIPYGTKSKNQCFDLYLPEVGDGPFPLIIHIHGGGFAFGDKRDNHLDAYLTGLHRGLAVASLGYRLSGEAIFPAAALDCREAVRCIRSRAKEFSIDPERIGVIGGSAGGNLAAMLGMNVPNGFFPGEKSGDAYSCEPTVCVAVDQFGPMNFSTIAEQARANGISRVSPDPAQTPEAKYLGAPIDKEPGLVNAANPATYAGERMAPMLVQHGTMDHLVPCEQSVEFVAALRGRGLTGRITYTPLEDADHEDKRFFQTENMSFVFDFIEQHL